MLNTNNVFKTEYPIVNNIVRTIQESDVTGRNKHYRDLYDSFAKFYTPTQKIMEFVMRVFSKERVNPINKFLQELNIKAGYRVLEVSIGTGNNVTVLSKDIDLYGLDISLGMLKECLKRHSKSLKLVLVHGMAENLPFQDESFDHVFHVDGINFFNDKAQAIKEMIRVAKPGAKFVIADETEATAKNCERMPIARRFFKNRDEVIVPPIDLIPKDMLDIKLSSCLSNDEIYVITFTKR